MRKQHITAKYIETDSSLEITAWFTFSRPLLKLCDCWFCFETLNCHSAWNGIKSHKNFNIVATLCERVSSDTCLDEFFFFIYHFDGICWWASMAECENKQVEQELFGETLARWIHTKHAILPHQNNREVFTWRVWISSILTCEIQIKIYGDLSFMLCTIENKAVLWLFCFAKQQKEGISSVREKWKL